MSSAEQMRLKILTPSRKRLKPGQIFAFHFDEVYGFGRIVRTDAVVGAMKDCILIYVYDYVSKDLTPPKNLSKEHLLFPPMMINRLPWSRGYLQVVENRELSNDDMLDIHCFLNPFKKTFHNEYGLILEESTDLVGRYGLGSYAVLDEKLIMSDFGKHHNL